uniref:Isoleucine--tRNA ligase n=1 Tax=Lygus hesperus TaxID=30085 RepID=A0A0A9ZCV4_LYGHE
MSGSIVIMIGFGSLAGGRGRMELIDQPIQSSHSIEEKSVNILLHLVRFPIESEIKINYYISSWVDTPEVLDSFFDQEYLQWFKHTVKSIPSVKTICKALGTYPGKVSIGQINILYWLLIGLREPKLSPLTKDCAKSVINLFVDVKQLGRVKRIFKVERTLPDNAVTKKDLLRFEYGYLSESISNLYGFLFHFQSIGTFQFFTDKIHHALQNSTFERSRWRGTEIKSSFCSLLVLEWNPRLARLFMNIESSDIPSTDEPNVYCTFSPTGIRISYVIILEPKLCPTTVPRKTMNILTEGFILSTSVSVCFLIIRTIFRSLLWPLR